MSDKGKPHPFRRKGDNRPRARRMLSTSLVGPKAIAGKIGSLFGSGKSKIKKPKTSGIRGKIGGIAKKLTTGTKKGAKYAGKHAKKQVKRSVGNIKKKKSLNTPRQKMMRKKKKDMKKY